MNRTPIRPYLRAGKIENFLQRACPELFHFTIFCLIGGIGLFFAIMLNAILVLAMSCPLWLAYALVIPSQFALNFYLSRRFLFEADNANAIQQSSLYLPGSLGLRFLDWLLYVFLVTNFSVPFWLAQVGNAIIFQIARYNLAIFVFSKRTDIDEEDVEHESQDGIVIGNVTDKSQLRNPVAARMVANFDKRLIENLSLAKPESVHEIGCGEGRLAQIIQENYGVDYLGTDFSVRMVETAASRNLINSRFKQADIYSLDLEHDHADTIVCCEVFEHLQDPEKALDVLKSLRARQYILSVPNEPIWRLLNLARLKYTYDRGNTPGHLNHWSSWSFRRMLKDKGFNIETFSKPFPWIMVRGQFKDSNN